LRLNCVGIFEHGSPPSCCCSFQGSPARGSGGYNTGRGWSIPRRRFIFLCGEKGLQVSVCGLCCLYRPVHRAWRAMLRTSRHHGGARQDGAFAAVGMARTAHAAVFAGSRAARETPIKTAGKRPRGSMRLRFRLDPLAARGSRR
jgi:hypothetical protein